MSDLTLVVGSKNYSSWSLRPWLALKVAGVPFHEVTIQTGQLDSPRRIAEWSPSGRVPLLADGALRVWDSLAICEYAAERFPAAGLWPSDPAHRAAARSVSAEMHSGFLAVRRDLFMDLRARHIRTWGADTQADIDRVCAIWRDCLAASGGPFLFGRFCIADAMLAPVAARWRTWSVPVDAVCARYRDAILGLPEFLAWEQDAAGEPADPRYLWPPA